MAQVLHSARNRCVAKLHAVPTAWFEPHRRAAIEAGMLKVVEAADPASDRSRFARYGSKLARVVETLERIHADDPDARVILFCQWRVLEVYRAYVGPI